MDCEKISDFICDSLRDFANNGVLILGMSGGIDSAVVGELAVRAIGKDKVLMVYLPTKFNTDFDEKCIALMEKKIGVDFYEINIDDICESFDRASDNQIEQMAQANIQARIRMTILYALANKYNGRVLGTGNESELAIGYFTKFGDGACDIEPIGDLYKTEVFELALYLGIPDEIIDRAPTAGLWEGQTDEEEIGMTYEDLDVILRNIRKSGANTPIEKIIFEKIIGAAHKNISPKIINIPEDLL